MGPSMLNVATGQPLTRALVACLVVTNLPYPLPRLLPLSLATLDLRMHSCVCSLREGYVWRPQGVQDLTCVWAHASIRPSTGAPCCAWLSLETSNRYTLQNDCPSWDC